MKRFLNKIKSKMINRGSTLVLVVVALGFCGILMGALLTAVGYAYRQKLYDYNAKSNFYYLEQAMDEIYAGVGSLTMESLQNAYETTREQAVKYDTTEFEYVNIGNEKANMIFKNNFMNNFVNSEPDENGKKFSDYFRVYKSDGTKVTESEDGIVKTLSSFISNRKLSNSVSPGNKVGTIELVPDDLQVLYYFAGSGKYSSVPPADSSTSIAKIVIKNVKLRRVVEYKRSSAAGHFSQTICTDIEISRPDFDVNFDGSTTNSNTLFEFCVISDSGVEVNKTAGSVLSMNGNIYAANDFYNKRYNNYAGNEESGAGKYLEDATWNRVDGVTKTYKMTPVTNYKYVAGDNNLTTLKNHNDVSHGVVSSQALYDGNNIKSKYSGFYVSNGSTVNVFANKMIVPGTIAVMDASTLNVYGIEGTDVIQSNVWTDEIVLAGKTQGLPKFQNSTVESISNEVGSKADFTANLYVKDDTQIESNYSKFRLNGKYFGYGNSTEKDSRDFVPTTLVDTTNGRNIYEEEYSELNNGVVTTGNQIRSHYNSSAFIVNGEHANVNLLDTESIFIAGRSYIELSKVNNGKTTTSYQIKVKENPLDSSQTTDVADKVTTTPFQYDSNVKDYKTGESLSIKTTQLAYKPDKAPEVEYYEQSISSSGSRNGVHKRSVVLNSDGSLKEVSEADATQTDTNGNRVLKNGYETEYFSELPVELRDMVLFNKYFDTANSDKDGKVPVIYVEENYKKVDKTDGKKYYYYLDFEFAYDNNMFDTHKFVKRSDISTSNPQGNRIAIDSADDLSEAFIIDYFNYVNYIDEADAIGVAALATNHTIQDRDVLGNPNSYPTNNPVLERTDTLAAITNYEDYRAGAIATSNKTNSAVYTSGSVTTSLDTQGRSLTKETLKGALQSDKDVTFTVLTSTDQTIKSTLLGNTDGDLSTTEVNSADHTSALDMSEEYETHYNYMKWALQDLPNEDSSNVSGKKTQKQFIDDLVASKGSESLSPLLSYFNYDQIVNTNDPTLGTGANVATSITPDKLRLSPVFKADGSYDYSEYKVWVDYNDVHVTCESSSDNHSVTGIIITKGDVYFDNYSGPDAYKTVNQFNGIIVAGGKVYINNSITNINASDLCKTIMNQCMIKAQNYNVQVLASGDEGYDAAVANENQRKKNEAKYAVKVLELFKDYEDVAAKYKDPNYTIETAGADTKEITNIDYSDVLRYNNWMRNVD